MYSVNNYILLIQVFSVLSRWICLKLLIVYFSCVFDRFDRSSKAERDYLTL